MVNKKREILKKLTQNQNNQEFNIFYLIKNKFSTPKQSVRVGDKQQENKKQNYIYYHRQQIGRKLNNSKLIMKSDILKPISNIL